jgi:hypothetical protein
MVGHNNVRTFRNGLVGDFSNGIKAAKTQGIGPNNKYLEGLFFEAGKKYKKAKKRKQKNSPEEKENGNVNFPKQGENTQNSSHYQKYEFQNSNSIFIA